MNAISIIVLILAVLLYLILQRLLPGIAFTGRRGGAHAKTRRRLRNCAALVIFAIVLGVIANILPRRLSPERRSRREINEPHLHALVMGASLSAVLAE